MEKLNHTMKSPFTTFRKKIRNNKRKMADALTNYGVDFEKKAEVVRKRITNLQTGGLVGGTLFPSNNNSNCRKKKTSCCGNRKTCGGNETIGKYSINSKMK